MQTLLTIIAALLPQTALPVAHADCIELNHVMTERDNGEWESRLDQIICWGTYETTSGTHVREWAVARELTIEANAKIPFIILDGRVIKSRVLCESWTDTDIEVDDRAYVPYEQRVKIK